MPDRAGGETPAHVRLSRGRLPAGARHRGNGESWVGQSDDRVGNDHAAWIGSCPPSSLPLVANAGDKQATENRGEDERWQSALTIWACRSASTIWTTRTWRIFLTAPTTRSICS